MFLQVFIWRWFVCNFHNNNVFYKVMEGTVWYFPCVIFCHHPVRRSAKYCSWKFRLETNPHPLFSSSLFFHIIPKFLVPWHSFKYISNKQNITHGKYPRRDDSCIAVATNRTAMILTATVSAEYTSKFRLTTIGSCVTGMVAYFAYRNVARQRTPPPV